MALSGGQHGGIAGGDIGTCRFVKFSSTDGSYIEGTALGVAHGISPEGSRNVPALGLVTTYAAIAGDPITPYQENDVCLLELVGANVTLGDRLMVGTLGKGEKATDASTASYAIALQSGVATEKIYVRIQTDTVGTS